MSPTEPRAGHGKSRPWIIHLVQGVAAAIVMLNMTAGASAQTGKIVGLGAVRCAVFTADLDRNPAMHRDYFAWAQGFMSGVLLSQPQGIDERLDLVQQSFPLTRQVDWLRQYCHDRPDQDFTDAILALYKRLRSDDRAMP